MPVLTPSSTESFALITQSILSFNLCRAGGLESRRKFAVPGIEAASGDRGPLPVGAAEIRMAQAAAHPHPASKPRKFRERDLRHVQVNPWLIAITVSLATFMEVMDTSIANVALRHIAGSLAAGQSESTWVLTSYLVSNAIILPISGWLASVMGRKRFYMTCVVTFTISSLVQQLFGYDATKAGLILMPGGLFIMALMPLVGFLVNKVQPKGLIAFGLLIEAASMYYLTHLNAMVSFRTIAIARVFQAGGLTFLFVPINTIAYIGLPPDKSNNASALINAMRNLGGSVGISFVTTVLDRRGQFHQNRLVGNIAPFHSAYRQAIANAARHFIQVGASPAVASKHAFASITQTLLRQAQMLSYLDVFKMLAIGSLGAISLAFLLKKINPEDRGQAQGH